SVPCASIPCAMGTEKLLRPRQLRVRRTCSLDTVVGSYLLGQWPRDTEGTATSCMNDKATQVQTPATSSSLQGELLATCAERRSASWGSTDHRREIAKLKQQLQRTKLSGKSGKDKEKSCPFPGDHTVIASLQDSPSGFPSPSPVLRLSPCLHRSLEGLNQELEEAFVKEQGDEELLRILDVPDGHRAPAPAQGGSMDASLALEPGSEESSPSPVLVFASSPRPNHSYVFKREPPEGCERVRAFEEALIPSPAQPFQPSCPDKNKVHFRPRGSAFCPVSLARPLLPTMEFLLRAPARNCDPWKLSQPEESVVFHSSLVV
ncbi:PREDICTED: protein FAM117A, partial [Acanthisitta chloris]|uniref:protein FAM117A n=1 Tax=Acanthisitta chloris TaxID=57068 RepID=UPI0004F0D80E